MLLILFCVNYLVLTTTDADAEKIDKHLSSFCQDIDSAHTQFKRSSFCSKVKKWESF